MSESCCSNDSFSEDAWNKISCSRALWKWRSLHAASGSSVSSSRAHSVPNAGASQGNRAGQDKATSWPSARGYAQLVCHDRKLFLHGGQSTINEATGDSLHYKDLHAYDIDAEQWTALPSGQHDRMAHSMHVVEFKGEYLLLVFGGFDPMGLRPELFDLKRGHWLLGSIGMCERRLLDEIELEREESSSSESPSAAPTDGDAALIGNDVGSSLTSEAMVALSSTDFLTRSQPQYRARKKLVKRWHHFEYRDKTNRYLHSSVQAKSHADTSTKIYVYGGTDSQSGVTYSDLMVIELTSTIMEDSSSHNPCFEMTRPECTGDAPGARLGHQACMLGTDAMLLYGGLGDASAESSEAKDDLYLVFRLDLNTFVWSTIDVQQVPQCRMLFCMCSDRTNSRIVVFGGRQCDTEDAGSDDTDDEDGEGPDLFVDAFIGQITADIEPTDSAQLRHTIVWRRATSHDGPFPREISVAACCPVVWNRRLSSSNDHGEDEDDVHGVHCFVFGGENREAVCVDGLTELTIDAEALMEDGNALVDESGDGAMTATDDAHIDVVQAVQDEAVLPAAATGASSSCASVDGVEGRYRQHEQPPLGLTGSIELSMRSHSTASPTTIRQAPNLMNSLPSDDVPSLLQALVDAVTHTNDIVQQGFNDVRQRVSAVEGRMSSLEDRMSQLERRDNGALHPQQQLINASLREAVAAINKELTLRR